MTVLDFNRTNHSDQPINIALNAVIDASVARERPAAISAPPRSAVSACARSNSIGCATRSIRRGCGTSSRADTSSRSDRACTSPAAGFVFAPDDRLKFVALDGMLSGHADGIFLSGPKIQDIAYPCLWEHKAVNAKGWRGLDRDGLAKAYPQYAAQVALYQHFLGVEENPAIFTAVNADTCERLHILVPYDAGLARATIKRAETVIEATRAGELLPRFTGNQDNWKCRMCGHKDRCWKS